MDNKTRKYGRHTAISIVVANMIGTGVFTSLGFQLVNIQSVPVILLLWIVGGVIALCGAFCYAELGAALPRSGGEYNFIGQIYHPAAGFVSGWISATIGFAAPTALAAITAATYFNAAWPQFPIVPSAVCLVVGVSLVHATNRRNSGGFQLVFTAVKVLLIIAFIVAGLAYVEAPQSVRWTPNFGDWGLVTSSAFAVALIYVNYAYTGWNAATYLTSEVEDAPRRLPSILIVGTLIVTLLYFALHIMFLTVAPMGAMAGKLEIGYVVADYAFGTYGSNLVATMLAILLISTVSAMVIAGPRALQVIGQDYRMLGFLSRENRSGVPVVAIVTQMAITLLLVVTSSFEAILVFAGFTLGLNTLITIVGVVVLRRSKPELARPFRVPLYPLPLIVFCGLTLWTLVFILFDRPVEGLFGLGLITTGWLFYQVAKDRVNA
jgi:APA family basic amino acid/polyamine antiporter